QRQVADKPPGNPAQPDTYHSDAPAAGAALSTAQRQWQDCVDAANGLRSQVSTAVQTAARAIVEAKGLRFKENPKWWDIGGQFTNIVGGKKEQVKTAAGGLR